MIVQVNEIASWNCDDYENKRKIYDQGKNWSYLLETMIKFVLKQ